MVFSLMDWDSYHCNGDDLQYLTHKPINKTALFKRKKKKNPTPPPILVLICKSKKGKESINAASGSKINWAVLYSCVTSQCISFPFRRSFLLSTFVLTRQTRKVLPYIKKQQRQIRREFTWIFFLLA